VIFFVIYRLFVVNVWVMDTSTSG